MSLPDDLLVLARELVNRDPTKPKQANLRRAISTAYYAVFHLLVRDSAARLVPGANEPLRNLVARAFNHGDMKKLCQSYASGGLPQPLRSIGATASPELRAVADGFVNLQQARHEADYDMARNIRRLEALGLVDRAQAAFDHWRGIQDPEARIFSTALLLAMHWRS